MAQRQHRKVKIMSGLSAFAPTSVPGVKFAQFEDSEQGHKDSTNVQAEIRAAYKAVGLGIPPLLTRQGGLQVWVAANKEALEDAKEAGLIPGVSGRGKRAKDHAAVIAALWSEETDAAAAAEPTLKASASVSV